MLSTHTDPFLAFARDLQIEGCDVHLYRGPNQYACLLLPETAQSIVESFPNENLYYLAGVRPGLQKRAADSDVLKRGMFTLDFDIRKELEKKGFVLASWLQILDNAERILESLIAHPFYDKMRYAVLSGNGMHVHYFGEPVKVEKEEWAAGMKDIFEEVNTVTPIPCDTGCGNAGRIMRMPGSWNVKDPADKKPVDFLVWMPGVSLPPLSFALERGRHAIEERDRMKKAERADFHEKNPEGGSDVIDLMNQIPIEQVAAQLLGVRVKQVKKDGGMRFCDEKGEERGFFKHHQFNVIVHEGTSLFDPPSGTGYNCLGFVRAVKKIGTREAVQWFAERSARIRDLIAKEKQQWKEDHKVRELADWRKNIPPTFTPQ